jgi:hypothetical protein
MDIDFPTGIKNLLKSIIKSIISFTKNKLHHSVLENESRSSHIPDILYDCQEFIFKKSENEYLLEYKIYHIFNNLCLDNTNKIIDSYEKVSFHLLNLRLIKF